MISWAPPACFPPAGPGRFEASAAAEEIRCEDEDHWPIPCCAWAKGPESGGF